MAYAIQSKFNSYLERKRREHGDKFNPSELAAKFIPYFNSGERIEVRFSYGEVKRGTIGITTGWKPCFLLMLTSRSIGSPWTLSDRDEIIRVIPRRNRR